MASNVTAAQLRVLTAVRDLSNRMGYPPTVREIGAEIGLKSPSTVHSHLVGLERAGVMQRHSRHPRAIQVDHVTAGVGDRRSVVWVPCPDMGSLQPFPDRLVPPGSRSWMTAAPDGGWGARCPEGALVVFTAPDHTSTLRELPSGTVAHLDTPAGPVTGEVLRIDGTIQVDDGGSVREFAAGECQLLGVASLALIAMQP